METIKKQVESKDINSYFPRVERSYRNLLQFKEQLNSYLCEPCTIVQYEAREKIRTKIDKLTKSHLALLNIYRNKRNNFNNVFQTMSDQLMEAKKLEEGINDYLSLVHS